jgi:hypothetical protein
MCAERGWPQLGQRFTVRASSVPHWRHLRTLPAATSVRRVDIRVLIETMVMPVSSLDGASVWGRRIDASR